MKGLGLTPLFGDRRGFMPPQLKTKQNLLDPLYYLNYCHWFEIFDYQIYLDPWIEECQHSIKEGWT